MPKNEHKPLNKKEHEIIRMTIEGETQRSIAVQLGVSPSSEIGRAHV